MSFDYSALEKYCNGMEEASKNLESFLVDFLQEEAEWVEGATRDRTPR